MSELDEAWAAALSEAEQKARLAGRKDVAEYLSLKNSNDLLRKAGIQWLIESFTIAAGEANRAGASIKIARTEGHRFSNGTSTMVGHLLTLTNGVRTLFVEAGWPRVPRDGIVHGGGLACANIRHMGIRSASEELVLARTNSGAPGWKSLNKKRPHLHASDIHHHIAILLDKPR
ncbi:MAG TPA: hypothetical protein VFI57_11270 [Pyrinomonadaceae bacterium]|jgi:hypothetical protein|nr:hypothetical protein [Pyrinomonadaceae bacterium]